jgi:DNA-binding transcriptional regulator YiaG
VPLKADSAAKHAYEQIIRSLKSARQDARLSRQALSSLLPVSGKAVFEWEAGNVRPTMEHLLLWVNGLERRLVIVDHDGALCDPPSLIAAKGSVAFELRRLAGALRERRRHLGLTFPELAELIGVTKQSVERWEAGRAAPRPLALIVWAQRLDRSVIIGDPIDRQP